MTGFVNVPMPPLMPSRNTAPSWRYRGGSKLCPMPAGVPVRMTVPFGSVVSYD